MRLISRFLFSVPFASALAISAEAQWVTNEFRDTFGRGTPVVMVDAASSINNRGRPERGRATLVIRRNDAYVITGDGYICHSPPNNPVKLSLQVDGGRVLDTQGADVSTDKTAVFLGQTALNMVLSARQEIKMETRDHCGATVSMTFRATNLHEVLGHVGRRPPNPPQQGNQRGEQQGAQTSQSRPTQQPAPPLPPRLLEGRGALDRREFAAAAAAARDVIATRVAAHQVEAQMLLGDALTGGRDFAAAAIAYDDARRTSPNGPRAGEATVGIANAFIGLGNQRDACRLLSEARTQIPPSGPVAERAADVRRRAQCQ